MARVSTESWRRMLACARTAANEWLREGVPGRPLVVESLMEGVPQRSTSESARPPMEPRECGSGNTPPMRKDGARSYADDVECRGGGGLAPHWPADPPRPRKPAGYGGAPCLQTKVHIDSAVALQGVLVGRRRGRAPLAVAHDVGEQLVVERGATYQDKEAEELHADKALPARDHAERPHERGAARVDAQPRRGGELLHYRDTEPVVERHGQDASHSGREQRAATRHLHDAFLRVIDRPAVRPLHACGGGLAARLCS